MRRISPAGVVNTLAGTAVTGSEPVATASFTTPASVALDSHGNLVVSEITSGNIRKITR